MVAAVVAAPGIVPAGPGAGVTAGPSGSGAGLSGTGTLPPDTGSRPAGVSFLLEGAASWNIDMVREFFKRERKVDMPAAPAPFANQDMLKAVNPEFAKRIEALIAIYQASGGGTDLGIAPKDGGIRSAQQQIKLFKECRRIKKGPDYSTGRIPPEIPYGFSDGPLVGDGSKEKDWEVIPVDERNCGDCSSADTITFSEDGRPSGMASYRLEPPNCPIFYTLPSGKDVMGPVTYVWVGWHNVGLAVDLRQIHGGKLILPNTIAWFKMTKAIADLGMTDGGWWGHKSGHYFTDPGHVEWHPKLHNPNRFATHSGRALGNDETDTGYKWKIPTRIYTWTGELAPRPSALNVHELVEDDGWVAVKKLRRLSGYENGSWMGTWDTYDPPVRLFPAYIPTILYQIESDASPDVRKGKVTRVTYIQTADADGKVTKDLREYRQEGTYSHERLYVYDWQKKANTVSEQKSDDAPRYIRLWNTSIYGINTTIRAGEGIGSERAQAVDVDGYTTPDHDWSKPYAANTFTGISLCLAWDRDNGKIGSAVELMKEGKEQVYDITEVTSDFNGDDQGCGGLKITVSAQLPKGAWDRETPPERAPSNPRPEKVAPLRCPPGVACLPPR